MTRIVGGIQVFETQGTNGHPEDRIYTVMSGVFYIGLGDKFDGDRVKAYPPGSVIVLPGDTSRTEGGNAANGFQSMSSGRTDLKTAGPAGGFEP